MLSQYVKLNVVVNDDEKMLKEMDDVQQQLQPQQQLEQVNVKAIQTEKIKNL